MDSQNISVLCENSHKFSTLYKIKSASLELHASLIQSLFLFWGRDQCSSSQWVIHLSGKVSGVPGKESEIHIWRMIVSIHAGTGRSGRPAHQGHLFPLASRTAWHASRSYIRCVGATICVLWRRPAGSPSWFTHYYFHGVGEARVHSIYLITTAPQNNNALSVSGESVKTLSETHITHI